MNDQIYKNWRKDVGTDYETTRKLVDEDYTRANTSRNTENELVEMNKKLTGATAMNELNFDGLTDAQMRLFAVRCARRVQHLMTDPRSLAALNVAERHAKGEATDDELSAATAAAWDASWAAARAASWDAECEAQQKILDEIRQEQPR